jgi:hypothetical protein
VLFRLVTQLVRSQCHRAKKKPTGAEVVPLIRQTADLRADVSHSTVPVGRLVSTRSCVRGSRRMTLTG